MSEKNSPELKRRKIETTENVDFEDNQNTVAENQDKIIEVSAKQIKIGDFVPTNIEDNENSEQKDPEDLPKLEDHNSKEVEERKLEDSEKEKHGNVCEGTAETNRKNDDYEMDEIIQKNENEEVIDQILGEIFEKTNTVGENQNSDFPTEDNAKEINIQVDEQSFQMHEDNNSSEKTEMRINQAENNSLNANEQNENQCEKVGDELCDKQSGDEKTEPSSNANAKEYSQLGDCFFEGNKNEIDNGKDEAEKVEKRFHEKNQESDKKCDETLDEPDEEHNGGGKLPEEQEQNDEIDDQIKEGLIEGCLKGNKKEINTGDQELYEDREKSEEIIDHVKESFIEEFPDGDEKVDAGEKRLSGEDEGCEEIVDEIKKNSIEKCFEGNEKIDTAEEELLEQEKNEEIVDQVKESFIEEFPDGDEKVDAGEKRLFEEDEGCEEIVDEIKKNSIEKCLEGNEKIDTAEEELLEQEKNEEIVDQVKESFIEEFPDGDEKVDAGEKRLSGEDEGCEEIVDEIKKNSIEKCLEGNEKIDTGEEEPLIEQEKNEEIVDQVKESFIEECPEGSEEIDTGEDELIEQEKNEEIIDQIVERFIEEGSKNHENDKKDANEGGQDLPENHKDSEEKVDQVKEDESDNKSLSEKSEMEQQNIENISNMQSNNLCEIKISSVSTIEAFSLFDKFEEEEEIMDVDYENESLQMHENIIMDEMQENEITEEDQELLAAINCDIQIPGIIELDGENQEGQILEEVEGNYQIPENIEEGQISGKIEDNVQMQGEIEEEETFEKIDADVQTPENIEEEQVFEEVEGDIQMQNEIEEDENVEKTDLNDQIPQSNEAEQISEVFENDMQTKDETEEEQILGKADGMQISENIEEKQISEEAEDEIQMQNEIEKGRISEKTDDVQIPENIEKISEKVEDSEQIQDKNKNKDIIKETEDNIQTQEDNETGKKGLDLEDVNEKEKLSPDKSEDLKNNEIENQQKPIDEIKEKDILLENEEEKSEIKDDNQTENVIPELIPITEHEVDDMEVMDEDQDIDAEEENECDDVPTIIELFGDEDKEDDDDDSQHHEEKLEENIEDNLKESYDNEIKTKNEKEITDNKKCHDSLDNNIFFGKECVNAECSNKSKSFLKAPEFVVNLYRLPRKNNNIQYVCEDCYDYAVLKYEIYCDALVNHRLLFDEEIPKRHEIVEILDSDEEDNVNDANDAADDEYLSKEAIDYLDDNLDEVLEEVCENVKIKDQLSMMNTAFDERLEKIQGDLNSQNNVLKELQTNANRMYSELYSCQRIKIKELPPLDLNTGRSYIAETEFTIPPQGELTYPPIQINGCYFAMRNKLIDNWLPCRVIEISDVTPILKFYRVKFENSKSPITRCISAKQLAYFDPPSVKLPIGTRVIALFDSTILHGKHSVQNALYPGIIAEPLTSYNRYRYLIFFDDGYSQYVSHKDVRLVCFASENVWEDVHISSKEFFRSYLTQYQKNRPMVQAKKGQTITTESNGKWLPAKVVDIDGSLVQMQFSGKNHTEWIYRGSTRLAPLYKERHNSKKATALSQLPRRTEPFIRYMENDESSISSRLQNTLPSSVSHSTFSLSSTTTPSSTATSTRAVAKKSVTKSPYSPITSSFHQQQQQQQMSYNQRQIQLHQHQIHQPQPSVKHLNNSVIIVDDDSRPKGKVVYYTAKKNLPPRQYHSHDCNPQCLFSISYNLNSYSPLAKPLLLGWERLIHRLKLKKWVQYRAPCGRILRNMEEIHRYLRSTKNTLNVDNFDFDPMVHCLAEYVIEKCIVQKPDLSDGIENMIIPCINYYDNTMPPECTYSTERLPTEGVHLNLDPEFLVGCDCTDDCSDKTKCSCWQLTLEGARFNNSNVPLDKIGYSYKRLPEPVPTGIYECNVRCKCSKNCLNRVVQHPLQMKLQVFKTSNRGWGLRCINDIPKGSFICIYAGHLLTEQNANEGGAHFGDEYFAELDYIEVVERLKEGYESDVQEDIESDDDSEEKNRGRDSDEEFRLHRKISTKSPSVHTRMQTRRETAKSSRSGSIDDDGADGESRRKVLNFDANPTMDNSVESTSTKYKSVRKYFGKDEYCYVMDAKLTGNIGRYFNHSCSPNLFVQNVFVDTHDLRFPWVAFFALHHIKAGTELTWNYNYEVGIVPGKVLYCECGASNCRGRLL